MAPPRQQVCEHLERQQADPHGRAQHKILEDAARPRSRHGLGRRPVVAQPAQSVAASARLRVRPARIRGQLTARVQQRLDACRDGVRGVDRGMATGDEAG